MNPTVWGPHFWNVLNILALTYPEKPDVQDQNNMTAFITSLSNVLPCDKCKVHFKKNLEKFPLSQALTSRNNLIKWVIDVHNEVNQRNGKRIYSYEDGAYAMKSNVLGGSFNTQHLLMAMTLGIGIFYVFRKTNFFKNLK